MPDPATSPPVRKARGCFFYGCLTGLGLLLIAGLLAFFAVRYVRNRIADYTDAAPMTLPKVEMGETESRQLQERVKAFGDAIEKDQPTEPLVLSERDVNALIANLAAARELADKFYISLEGDQVKGRISIPVPNLAWLSKGRYLNGDGTFNASLENGVLVVTAREVRVKGRPLPDAIMDGLRQQNLAEEACSNPKNADAIRKLGSIQVKDGHVIIQARPAK